MSSWYWRVVAFKAAFVLTCLASYLKAEDIIQKLPFCDPNTPSVSNKDLIIVSTLDGRITAFSSDSGVKAWDLQTQPLLTSTLHQVELTAGGKWVRLVPSLRGALYSLSGDTIEPLPFDAEQLLFSSFKYSDDLVIAGARESLWMGLDVHTGGVVYQCGTKGCNSEKETAGVPGEVLVLRRSSNVVRALEPRTGTEKWNFSVAEHHLAVSNSRGCDSVHEGAPLPEYVVAVAVPEGLVVVRDHHTQMLLWQQKLEAPVASMWRLRRGTLQNIDVLWAATKSLSTGNFVQASPPALYIGLHNQQLYVQEGTITRKNSNTAVAAKPMPFKLKFTRPLIAGPNTAVQQKPDSEQNALSLIALYDKGQTVNHGFFLYLEEKCSKAVQVTDGDLDPELSESDPGYDDRQVHMHVHVYSLWYWWKEVVLIAISSALLMNLMIWPRLFVPRSRPSTPVTDQSVVVVERHYSQPSVSEYSGRYYNDFEPLRCLGRGGFGVVFEARNKIDHRSYAVKRITLPRRESKRERVLREVRALAKLEHENIVRYFNAWLEEPPPHWQQEKDAIWKRELDDVSVTMNDEYTSQKETNETSPPYSPLPTKSIHKPANVMLNLQPPQWEKSIDACFDALEYDKQFVELKRNRSLSCNDSVSIEFNDHMSKADSKTNNHTTGNSLEVPNDTSTLSNTLSLSKHTGGGDLDDSFIVFANSEDGNHNSNGTNEVTVNKYLEKVKQCDGLSKSEPEPGQGIKKQKGHRRHWSLDMCVRAAPERTMYLYIQMQLCLRESLHDWLRNNRDYCGRGEKAITFFNQIVSAVEYVHLAGLIHRDLKPSNILFSPDGKVKVGDFGLVTAISDSSQDECTNADTFNAQQRHTYKVGTHLYMSPEQLRGLPYDYKVDIYSLGLVLFELLQPFHTEAERVRCLLSLRKGQYPDTFKDKHVEEMEVLKLMLSEDPSLRPTASGVRSRAPLYHHTNPHWHFLLPQTQHVAA